MHPPRGSSMNHTLTASLFAALTAVTAVHAQDPQQPPPPTDYTPRYTKQEVMIPMRDGVRLFTAVYAPRDTAARHPVLMVRTPYSSGPYGADRFPGVFKNSTIPAFRS